MKQRVNLQIILNCVNITGDKEVSDHKYDQYLLISNIFKS